LNKTQKAFFIEGFPQDNIMITEFLAGRQQINIFMKQYFGVDIYQNKVPNFFISHITPFTTIRTIKDLIGEESTLLGRLKN
jgi:hypothetical protein